jgi:hypothetical protein
VNVGRRTQSSRHTPCAVRNMSTSFPLRHPECAYYYKRRAGGVPVNAVNDFFLGKSINLGVEKHQKTNPKSKTNSK